MRRNLIGLAIVLALACGAVIAQTGQGKLAMGANLRQRVIKNLNLSDAQKAQAKTIFQGAKQAAALIRPQVQENRQALEAAVKSNDATKIKQHAAAAGVLQGELVAIRSTAMAQFYAILAPDQQTKLGQMQAKIRQLTQQLRGGDLTAN